ncbi:hypothetical protein O1L60_21930 [Streptomyces diastatochromogenes]|nr:hypothetical protein [Streptomyces diastatochromogenes]
MRPVRDVEDDLGVTPVVAVLRLLEPVPVPRDPLVFDRRPMPGARLLVSAYADREPYSCLLEVKGRSGNLLRVAGEFTEGLAGAPAFSQAGALVGLLLGYGREGRGLLVPVAVLEDLLSAVAATGL